MKKVNFSWTGHPFVDAGLMAILAYSEKTNPEDLEESDIFEIIDFVSELYAKDDWSNFFHRSIFPNNGIIFVNPSMRKKRTPENIKKNLLNLYKSIELSQNDEEICSICGKYKSLKESVYRSNFPLLGTGNMRNFFFGGQEKGENICAYCLFLVHFLPLSVYNLSKLLLIHGYPYSKILKFTEDAVDNIRENYLFSSAPYKVPENFFFEKLIEITRKIESGSAFWKNTNITLYYFINGNRSGAQEINIINIPNSATYFIAFASEIEPSSWQKIIALGWNFGNTSSEKLKRTEKNKVYEKLLKEESILPYFLDKKRKKVNSSWKLLDFYCREVLGVNKEALDFIKKVGDRIVETIENLEDNKLKKIIRILEKADKLYKFENFFIKVEKIRQQMGLKSSILSFDEFAKLLVSYGEDINTSWKTVRDLILFRIYEKLHDRLAGIYSEDENVLEEIEEI